MDMGNKHVEDLEFRIANVDDLSEICRLESHCDVDNYSNTLIKESFENKNNVYLLACKNNLCLAYLNVVIVMDECNLVKIVVDRSSRYQGIATGLLYYLFEFVKEKGVTKIYLEVRQNNVNAKKLYEKVGFRKEHVRNKYYDDGTDAEIFWYYL